MATTALGRLVGQPKKPSSATTSVRIDAELISRAELVVQMSEAVLGKKVKFLTEYISNLIRDQINDHYAKALVAQQKHIEEEKRKLQEEKKRKPSSE